MGRNEPAAVLGAYLARLGIDERPPATLDTLHDLHRRHVGRIPYENLAIMLGAPPSVTPRDSFARVGDSGRAGYCFHHNGAFETALTELGFAVERRHGHVWFHDEHRYDEELTHLALVVTDLPTTDNPDGRWWVDAGLGDAFFEPLPLVEGEHEQGGFRYRIEGLRPDAWTFLHDPAAHSFTGIEVTSRAVDASAVEAAHEGLSTPPGMFTRVVVAQRRDARGIDSLKCCRLLRTAVDGQQETILTTYDAWRSALVDVLRVRVHESEEGGLEALYDRMWLAHLEWDEAGRP